MKKNKIIMIMGTILLLIIILMSILTIKVEKVNTEDEQEKSIALYSQDKTKKNINEDKYIINDIKNKKQELEDYLKEYKYESLKEMGKKYYIMLSNFLFYGGSIDNITIHDLKDESKSELLELYVDMDNIVKKKFPSYKDNLEDKYKNIKYILKDDYNETINSIINAVGIDEYNKMMENDAEIIEEKSVYEKAKEKIVKWTEDE